MWRRRPARVFTAPAHLSSRRKSNYNCDRKFSTHLWRKSQ